MTKFPGRSTGHDWRQDRTQYSFSILRLPFSIQIFTQYSSSYSTSILRLIGSSHAGGPMNS